MAAKPGPGETIVQRTSIESSNQQQDPDKLPPFWEYVESLNDADWASQGYRFVIERGRKELKSDERSYIGDFFEKLTPADIAKRWGGGDYTIWFKVPPKGQQLKYKVGLKVDGAPLTAAVGASASSNGAVAPGDPISQMISMFREEMRGLREELKLARGGDAATQAVQQAVGLTGQVFSAATQAATQTLTNIAGASHPAAAPNPMQDIQMQLMQAMIAKMLNPSDPIETFAKMLAAVKTLGLGGAVGSGSTVAQLAIEGIRVLPQAISEGVKGLQYWHLAEEARARQVATMRGQNPNPINVTPQPPPPVSAAAPPAPPPPVNATANPAPQSGGGEAPSVQVNIESIEIGLVRILANQAFTIEEAAHRAAALMEDLVPGMPDQVAAAGEAQILKLFQERPILMQVPQNPRLTEFIKKFIEVVRAAPYVAPPQPNAPPA